MAGYLIAEEGPVSGLIIHFEKGNEWIMGRDPDAVGIVLEDPMVSRKHVICRKTPEGYILENLSSVNPATQNGKIITEPVLLHEGDIIQIGNTFFRFSQEAPIEEQEEIPAPPSFIEEAPEISSLSLKSLPETRWMIKVVSGPNSGAEFHMQPGASYVIGKDPAICDVVFQDLSVSKQHAKISLDEASNVYIEDLGSRNGTLVNGAPISNKHQLSSQDMISLGTTTFLAIDREQSHITIVSTPAVTSPQKVAAEEEKEVQEVRNWRDMVILKKHLVLAAVFGIILFVSFIGIISLFQSEPIVTVAKHEGEQIKEIIKNYPDVQFSYNEGSGKLFLTGHVLTSIEKQELSYQLRGFPFLTDIEDSVVIDEYVWENMNALLVTNSDWQGISIHSPAPGKFVLRGYLQTPDQAAALSDYINMNFPYLDRLDNQVVIENNLMTLIESQLLERGFNNVTYQLTNGELVLSGRVDGKDESIFEKIVSQFKTTRGVRSLKNYVVYTSEDSSLVDLTSKYKVMGYSKRDGENQFVVVNGRILTMGDILDGMMITTIHPNMILLEKDGLKFKINYNLQ